MSLNGHWVAMSETQPWKFFALQRLNFQSLKLNFQFLEGNFKMSEPCVDGIETICTKFMEKLYPSKPGHSCGLSGTQLAQLKELGCGKKPYFSSKLLLGHF